MLHKGGRLCECVCGRGLWSCELCHSRFLHTLLYARNQEYYDPEKSMLELVFAPCSPLAGGNTNWMTKSDEVCLLSPPDMLSLASSLPPSYLPTYLLPLPPSPPCLCQAVSPFDTCLA